MTNEIAISGDDVLKFSHLIASGLAAHQFVLLRRDALGKMTGKKLALDLLQYCKSTGDWQPGYTNKPLGNLITFLEGQSNFAQYFNSHLAYDLLKHDLEKPDWLEKPSITDVDAEQLLIRLAGNIEVSAADHWIIVPLRGADLETTIQFKNFTFIGGTRDQKIKELQRLYRVSLQEVLNRVKHTETTRSPGFFAHPLMAIRVKDQTDNVEYIAKRYALWCLCAIHAVYWGYVYPASKRSWARNSRDELEREKICEHLYISATKNWRCRHQGFISSPQCFFDLDWLQNSAHQRRLMALYTSFIDVRSHDNLTSLFYRSLRFLGRAISIGQSPDEFEGLGITLLYLMIAAEGILLNNNFEKRLRLSVLLPRLAKYPGYTIHECTTAIDRAYRLRSDFVHSGSDVYPTHTHATNFNTDLSAEESPEVTRLSDEEL